MVFLVWDWLKTYDRFSIENGNEKAGTGIVQNNFNLYTGSEIQNRK